MTINITKDNINEVVVTGSFDIAGSVSADEDSKAEAKSFTLRIVCTDTPLVDIIRSMCKDKKINWQVGARKNMSKIVPNSIIEVPFSGSRSIPVIDPEVAMEARLRAMTPEARNKWFADKMASIK
jgi:hypothetical protein